MFPILLTLALVVSTLGAPVVDINALVATMFAAGDKNNDGIYSKSEADALTATLDLNGDKRIDKGEYVASWTAVNPQYASIAEGVFGRFDADGNGYIDQSDLNAGYAVIDVNGDGQVTKLEFTTFVSVQLAQVISQVTNPTNSSSITFTPPAIPSAMIELGFSRDDTNQDGVISFDEEWTSLSRFDRNNDGSISKIEFVSFAVQNVSSIFGELGPAFFDVADYDNNGVLVKGDVIKLFQIIDGDRNGMVSKEEAVQGISKLNLLLAASTNSTVSEDYGFNDADTNGDGRVTSNEEWGFWLNLDANNDNKVSFDEFNELFQYYPLNAQNASAAIFRRYDNNSDGFFENVDIGGFFSDMDSNGDGSVSVNTYATFIEILYDSYGVDIRQVVADVARTMRGLTTAFNLADLNGDHNLSVDEEYTALQTMDKNGDNVISREEYLSRYSSLPADWQAAGSSFFNEVDFNKDGVLNRDDIVKGLQAIDTNGDGKVTVYEYIDFVAKLYIRFGVSLGSMTAQATVVNPVLQSGFNLADTNKDGFISPSEQWASVLRLDQNGDGKVSLAEYLVTFAKLSTDYQVAGPKIFKLFDVDQNGFFEQADINAGFGRVDANGDGRISLDEYSSFVTQLYSSLGLEFGLTSVDGSTVQAAFRDSDLNNDGQWTVDEKWTALLRFDANGDGKLSLQEYSTEWSNISYTIQALSPQIFAAFDANKDGFLDKSDITIGRAGLDTNGDGTISYNEYLAFLSQFLLKAGITVTYSSTVNVNDFGFAQIDANNDGIITPEEAWNSLVQGDQNGDGKINVSEYIALFGNVSVSVASVARAIFNMTDADQSNFIEAAELKKNFMGLDANGDGSVRRDEYVQFFINTYSSLGIIPSNPGQSDFGFSFLDTNKNGFVTFDEEWVAILRMDTTGDTRVSQAEYVASLPPEISPVGPKIFSRADTDSNGFLERDDIRRLVTTIDTNGDGQMSAPEYTSFVRTLLTSLGVDVSKLG